MNYEHADLTHAIIGAAYEVHSELGYGFLESVYQNAMEIELTRRGLKAELEYPLTVYFKGVDVGKYKADLLVERTVIVELKAAAEYDSRDEAQLLNELKAARMKIGLLINFGRRQAKVKRMVM